MEGIAVALAVVLVLLVWRQEIERRARGRAELPPGWRGRREDAPQRRWTRREEEGP